MGYFNDLFIDACEFFGKDEVDDFQFDFYLNLEKSFLSKFEIDFLTADFFNDVFCSKKSSEYIYGMCSDAYDNVFNFRSRSVVEFLEKICKFRTQKINVYFSPVRYSSLNRHVCRKNAYASSTKVFFVDIDDLTFDFSTMSEEEIVKFLVTEYNLEFLPNWILASGHGLHIYYVLDDVLSLKNPEIFSRYIDSMIFFFKADVSCRNTSRILRVPFSYNAKYPESVIKTRLFHLNETPYKLHDLDFFLCDPSLFEEYRLACEAKKTDKRNATRAKNRALKEKEALENSSFIEELEPLEFLEHVEKDSKKSESIALKKKSKPKFSEEEFFYVNMKPNFSKLPKHRRFVRLLRDLQNFVVLRHCVPIGKRSTFCHIYASIAKRAFIPEAYVLDYFSLIFGSFFSEAEKVLASVYKSSVVYMYSNARIAELLEYDELDFEHCQCCYTAEQVARSKAERNALYYNSQEEVREKRLWKEYRFEYVASHIEESSSFIAKQLGCSVSTVKRIKRSLRA